MLQQALCSHANSTHLSSQSIPFALKIGSYTLSLNKKQQTNVSGALCRHANSIHLSSQSIPFALKIGLYTLSLNKKQRTNILGAICMINLPVCLTSSPESIIRTIVAPLDEDLNEALLRLGNVSPAESSVPGWYDPTAMLIGIHKAYMCNPISSDLGDKLTDARQCILKILLREISHDIFVFGGVRPNPVSLEAYYTPLFKVLLTMVETLIRVRMNDRRQAVNDGPEELCSLGHVDKEARGWRITWRRCIDGKEFTVIAEWAYVEYLPGFAFDDSNFHGHTPVRTWNWFSSVEGRLQDEHPEPPKYEDEGLELDNLFTSGGSEKELSRLQDKHPEYEDEGLELLLSGGSEEVLSTCHFQYDG